MRRLVEALLYLSKIEGGQLPIEREPVDLTELLSVTAARIAPLTDQAGQKLVVDFDTEATCSWHGDARLLERLLANLAENAAKYAPEGATITISAGAGRPSPALDPAAPAANGAFVVATDDTPSLPNPMATRAVRRQRLAENGRAAVPPTVWVTGPQHRQRDSGRGFAPCLRAVLSRGEVSRARGGRHGSGVGYRAGDRRRPRGRDHLHEQRRGGHQLHGDSPGSRCDAGAARSGGRSGSSTPRLSVCVGPAAGPSPQRREKESTLTRAGYP